MKEVIESLKKALSGVEGSDQIIAHVESEVEKSKADKPEIRKARLAHLKEQIALIAKNFEGPTQGAVTMAPFASPDQKTPTAPAPVATGNAAPVTNFASNQAEPTAGAGANPSAGQTLGTVAPGSGFADPVQATFAKTADEVRAAADKIDPNAVDGKPKTEPAAPVAPVAKTTADVWPLDMNAKATDTDWGKDPR
jgi:hypothetical protein